MGVEYVVSKRYDFIVDSFFYFNKWKDWVMFSVLEVPITVEI